MCGIAGILDLKGRSYPNLRRHLGVMNKLQAHRGPDGKGVWLHPRKQVGFGHRRLSIIDLETGAQPMSDRWGNVVCYNGEIYNYIELKKELGDYKFRTSSDTEVILAAYKRWGKDCVKHLRGMFALAIWDDEKGELFCARDRFGIKPFYYAVVDGVFYFASEAKALLPFLPGIKTNVEALKDYLVFQFVLGKKTLFEGVEELLPGQRMVARDGDIRIDKYWEVYYELDFHHTRKYFEERLRELIKDSVKVHTRSDVPVGAYVSGGVDSGIVASVARRQLGGEDFKVFTGKFSEGDLYDESGYARVLAREKGMRLHEVEITHRDFTESMEKVIYYLDFPVAGPGSFPQYIVSKLAAEHRKVVLGGQGGDEIFGGYVRYLVAYFEQCIKGAIDGTLHNGNFVVTYESIIPNLVALGRYKPMLREFWKEGLFEDLAERYFRLVNRASTMEQEVSWDELGDYSPFETFKEVFNGKNVGKESYFDKMTHFDFKTLLPALLQVEDRMSMAHGLESRVPFLDHELVEFVATMPSNIKFKSGTLKKVLVESMKDELPEAIIKRTDKMGFPVPLSEWLKGELRDFVGDIFSSRRAGERRYVNNLEVMRGLSGESRYGRKIWGLLSLELWRRQFHDREAEFKKMASG
jgi:asparagine synthase (glutamine-hydrolysing)